MRENLTSGLVSQKEVNEEAWHPCMRVIAYVEICQNNTCAVS